MLSVLLFLNQYKVFLSKGACVHMGHSTVLGTVTQDGLSNLWPVLKEQYSNSASMDGC
jgi:hypothetical protein